MTPVLVDSNVILDTLSDDPVWSEWSADAIASLADTAQLIINPIIFAEVSVRYSRIEDVDEALPATLRREDIPYKAAFLAGKVFSLYRRRGGLKRSPLPDFFVGAHAAVAGYRLLTRDPSRYRSYFPKLEVIAP
jgi:predicted nucleic acid-binding protein